MAYILFISFMKQLQVILQARILSVIWIMTGIMTKSKKH